MDAYSLCPGGTGKKIKFCCGDFLPELQKIDRMVEGEQYLACLKHIDHLLEQEPGRDRACLLATKCELLHATDQPEAARKTAAAFLAKHPDNQIALAESAIVAAESDARKALDLIQRALRAADGELSAPHVSGDGVRGRGPASTRAFPAGPGAVGVASRTSRKTIVGRWNCCSAMSQAGDIPLLLRDDPPLRRLSRRRAVEGPIRRGRCEPIGAGRLANRRRAVGGVGRRGARFAGHLAEPGHVARLVGRQSRLHRGPAPLRVVAGPRAGGPGGRRRGRGHGDVPGRRPAGRPAEDVPLVWTVKDVERRRRRFCRRRGCGRCPSTRRNSATARLAAAQGGLRAVGSPHARIGRRAEAGNHSAAAGPRPCCSGGRPTARPASR